MAEHEHIPAAVRYKEITATADNAARQLREHESAKAARLTENVVATRQLAEQADEQRTEVSNEIDRLWNMAMSALREERWLRVTNIPEPDSTAATEHPKKSKERVAKAYNELINAKQKKSSWIRTFRRNTD